MATILTVADYFTNLRRIGWYVYMLHLRNIVWEAELDHQLDGWKSPNHPQPRRHLQMNHVSFCEEIELLPKLNPEWKSTLETLLDSKAKEEQFIPDLRVEAKQVNVDFKNIVVYLAKNPSRIRKMDFIYERETLLIIKDKCPLEEKPVNTIHESILGFLGAK